MPASRRQAARASWDSGAKGVADRHLSAAA